MYASLQVHLIIALQIRLNGERFRLNGFGLNWKKESRPLLYNF